MIEVMWKLGTKRIVEVARMRAVLRGLEQVPGFEPTRYDLNQHGNWRAWDVEKAAVDALNEKVQVVRAQGADGAERGGLALVAMSGEEPAAACRAPSHATPAEIVATWAQVFAQGSARVATVTSASWRAQLARAGVDEGVPAATVWACGEGGFAAVRALVERERQWFERVEYEGAWGWVWAPGWEVSGGEEVLRWMASKTS